MIKLDTFFDIQQDGDYHTNITKDMQALFITGKYASISLTQKLDSLLDDLLEKQKRKIDVLILKECGLNCYILQEHILRFKNLKKLILIK
jgi:hypothetical protein